MVGEVVEKWPRYSRAHVVLATVHLGLNEPERARVELETAEALSPDAPRLWAVWAQYHLAQNDPIAAATKMKRAVALDPDNWQLRIQAARIFQGAGNDEAASEHVAVALQLIPSGKRAEVRRFIERMMGPGALSRTPTAVPEEEADDELDLPDPSVIAPPPQGASGDPSLMLGNPSNLRLRDPDQSLKLDLDE